MSSNHLENTTSCLIQKGVAGFGNRIFALAGAITYAEMTGRRLYVDWRDNRYAPDGINAFPLYFTSSVISEDIHTPEEPSVYPKIWHDNLNLDLWGLETKMEGAPRPGPR